MPNIMVIASAIGLADASSACSASAQSTPSQTVSAAIERQPPRWSVPPRVEPSSRLLRSGLETASATIRCRARPDGHVEACRVTAEEPFGTGLGRDLMAAARDARIDPNSLDQAGDDWISFTARFRLEPLF